MSFDYFESVDNVRGWGDNARGTIGDVAKDQYNRIAYPKIDAMVREKIRFEGVQIEAPIQFDISYSTVKIFIELPDEYYENPETYDMGHYNKLQEVIGAVGSRQFVEDMFRMNGVNGFDDMGKFEGNPAYVIKDDGFSFTDIDGLTYIIRRERHSISTQMMNFQGLFAKPMFEDLPKGYVESLIPDGLVVDKDQMDDNQSLRNVIDSNNLELIRFVRSFSDCLSHGEVVEDDISFVINTLPMRYSINDINNPELTRYEIYGGNESIGKFVEDLTVIAEEYPDEYHDLKNFDSGEITVRDIVHTSVNYIGRAIEGDRNYNLIQDVRKERVHEIIERQPDKKLRKTYDEAKCANLEVNGEVIRYHDEDTYDGRNRINKELGLRPDMVNMHVTKHKLQLHEDMQDDELE